MTVEKPTLQWRGYIGIMDSYTEKSISETERKLEDFQHRLRGINSKDRDSILCEVKRVILDLNVLSARYPGMIETGEREELYEFIVECAKEAGLEINEREDITQQWREW